MGKVTIGGRVDAVDAVAQEGDRRSARRQRAAVALEWRPTEGIMLYGAYSGGFKSGGTNDSVRDVETPFQEETLAGRKVIISKRRQDWADAENEANAADVFHIGSRAFFTSLMQYPLTLSLSYIQVVLVMAAGGLMVIAGVTTLGVVMAFSGYVALLSSPLSQIANLVSNALNAAAGGERIFEVIDQVPDIEDAPDAVDFEFRGGHIQFIDVDFGYVPGQKILRNNNFDVQPGESIGICGPTGAGKSTIINILTRYYDLDRGQILIDGQDISTLTRSSLREQVGAVGPFGRRREPEQEARFLNLKALAQEASSTRRGRIGTSSARR